MELITVKSAPFYAQTGRIALWQKHPDHPSGEAFVAGDIVAQVANTEEVQTRIANGFLVVTDEQPTIPFEGYGSLATSEVVERLAGVGDTERVLILQYEATHRKRAAILNPDSAPAEPFEGYDALTATQVLERLATLTDEERAAVQEYETANKNRKTVIEAL